MDSGREFGKGDRCGYWYYRGRIFLYQRRLRLARGDLGRSFEECWNVAKGNARSVHTHPPFSRCGKRRRGELMSESEYRLILIYWITASIPLGYFPSLELLEYFGLREEFGEGLLRPLKVRKRTPLKNLLSPRKKS